ncbi:alpha/beta hydrolase fold domain-containing protein [Verrucomicrobiota bacterium]
MFKFYCAAFVGCLALAVLSTAAPAKMFEIDDAYNRRLMANNLFYKSDKSGDWKLTGADGVSWEKYGALDGNADGAVSFDEFVAGADIPYPRWDGEVTRNIVYKRAGGEVLLMDIYEPLVKRYETAPVFYYTHGGGWSGGSKEIGGDVRPLFEALSREGFVCVGVRYRLVKTWNPDDPVLMRDCLVDCRDGLRFLKKHEAELGLDMDKVAVFGSSAGGHITQLLTWSDADAFAGDPALKPYKVNVATGVSWFGPSDFRDTQLFVSEGVKDKFLPDHWARRITKSRPGEFCYERADAETRRTIEELSPVWWLKKESRPLLHIHGDRDPVISITQAHHLKKQVAATGAPVEIQIVKGAGHSWANPGIMPDRKTVERMSVDYILRQLTAQ